MNIPQLQLLGTDSQNDGSNSVQQEPNAMAQNNDLMRQMQQQWTTLASHQGDHQSQQPSAQALGQIPNLNANALMNAFQQTGPSGQMPIQGAENVLASMLAAANGNAQAQSVPVQQSVPEATTSQGSLAGLQGLDQLQNFNQAALRQAVVQQQQQQQQQQQTGFPDLQQQSLNGLQGLQQQIVNLQQQLGVAQQPTSQLDASLHSQQLQPQQGQSNQNLQQQQFPQQHQQIPNWMGQAINPVSFNPTALGLATGALTGTDQNNFQPENAVNEAMSALGVGIANPAFQFQQQQQFQHQQQLGQGAMPQMHQQLAAAQLGMTQGVQQTSSAMQSNVGIMKSKVSDLTKTLMGDVNTQQRRQKTKKPGTEKKKRVKSFPEKLMQAMMEHADDDAVAWLPDGKSFVIVNPDMFCNKVLNKVFKESKFASFVRKLHRWGFVRLTSGTGTDCFHHPHFQRNKKEMAGKISCAVRNDKDKESKGSAKPPSLAGVEKFIRAKVVAAASSAASNAEKLQRPQENLAEDGNVEIDN